LCSIRTAQAGDHGKFWIWMSHMHAYNSRIVSLKSAYHTSFPQNGRQFVTKTNDNVVYSLKWTICSCLSILDNLSGSWIWVIKLGTDERGSTWKVSILIKKPQTHRPKLLCIRQFLCTVHKSISTLRSKQHV
jgi:hypothetical protein